MSLRRSFLGLLVLLVPLSGCWDGIDIDRRMIVSPIGIDAGPGEKIAVSFRMPLVKPIGMGGAPAEGGKSFIVRETVADAIYPALEDVQNRDEHAIFLGQCRSLVFGEDFARRGIRPTLDFFERYAVFPRSALVVVAKPSARALLDVDWPEQELHDQNIRAFFMNSDNRLLALKMWALTQEIDTPLQDPAVPLVEPSDNSTTMKLLGLAIFKEDRMVGELDNEEATLLEMMKKSNKYHRFSVKEGGREAVSFHVISGRNRIRVSRLDGRPRFLLQISLRAFLAEDVACRPPFSIKNLRLLEEKSENYIKEKYLSLLRKLQELGSDPVDLGNSYRIQEPRHFSLQRWPEDYRRATFAVKVEIHIDRLGVLR